VQMCLWTCRVFVLPAPVPTTETWPAPTLKI